MSRRLTLLDGPPDRVALHCRYGIGDLAMSLPALRAARRAAADAPVTWVAAEPARELLDWVRHADDGLVLHRDLGLRHWGDDGDAGRIDAWLDSLSPRTLHLGVHHSPRGLRRRITHGRYEWRHEHIPTQDAAGRDGRGPEAAVTDSAAIGWEVDVLPQDREPRDAPPPHDAEAAAWLADRNLHRPLAASVTGSSDLKVWPPARLAALLDFHVRRTGRDLVLIAGPDVGRADAARRAMRYGHRLRTLGRVHLLTLAGILHRCAAFVGNDTGTLQLAAAVGTRSVGLFGPTRAGFYAPRGCTPLEPPAVGCPLRRPDRYGPPACTTDHACRLGLRSCVDGVSLMDAARALRRLAA